MQRRSVLLLVFALSINLAARSSPAAGVIYVDKDATSTLHDGVSWCTAFTDLTAALDAAQPGDTIRVADGTYLPDTTGLADPHQATFRVFAWKAATPGAAGPIRTRETSNFTRPF